MSCHFRSVRGRQRNSAHDFIRATHSPGSDPNGEAGTPVSGGWAACRSSANCPPPPEGHSNGQRPPATPTGDPRLCLPQLPFFSALWFFPLHAASRGQHGAGAQRDVPGLGEGRGSLSLPPKQDHTALGGGHCPSGGSAHSLWLHRPPPVAALTRELGVTQGTPSAPHHGAGGTTAVGRDSLAPAGWGLEGFHLPRKKTLLHSASSAQQV